MSHIPPNGPPYYYPGAPPTTGGYAYVPVAAPVMMPMYAPPPHQPPPHHPPPHHPHPPHYPPPHHPPPSHYPPPQHYPPPPPTPAPEPPSQTTYVTNYVYEQPQQPGPSITVIEAPAQPLKPWQAIAGIAGSLISEVSKIGNNQQTISHVYNEVAVAESRPEPSPEPPIDWVPATTSSASSYSHRAFVGGKEGWDGSPLWIIRAHHSGELVPGKLSVKQRAAYIPHGGREIPVHNFEILCAPQNSLRWVPAGNGQVPVGAIPAGNTHNAEPLYIARCRHMRSSTPGKVHPSHTTAYISYGGSEIPYRNYEVLCKIV